MFRPLVLCWHQRPVVPPGYLTRHISANESTSQRLNYWGTRMGGPSKKLLGHPKFWSDGIINLHEIPHFHNYRCTRWHTWVRYIPYYIQKRFERNFQFYVGSIRSSFISSPVFIVLYHVPQKAGFTSASKITLWRSGPGSFYLAVALEVPSPENETSARNSGHGQVFLLQGRGPCLWVQ